MMNSKDYPHQQVVNGMLLYFAKRNWKKLKRSVSFGSINKLVSLKNDKVLHLQDVLA